MNKVWSELNKTMQTQIKKKDTYKAGIDILFDLRNQLMETLISFNEELSREDFDAIPFINADGYHSKTIAYSIWHIFRIEDIVAHTLISENEQVFFSGNYQERINSPKEIIMSPETYHEFEGQIQVALKRQADIFVDFENEDSFEDVEIVEGNLEETVCEPWDDADEYEMEDAYDICPKCGKPINYQNDAGNGFCVTCTQNEK